MSKRDEYVEKFKAQLDEWNADIVKLEDKARIASAETRTRIEERIAAIKASRDEATAKLAALRESTEEKWETLKDATEAAWAAFKEKLSSENSDPPAK